MEALIFVPVALAAGALGYLRKPIWSAALLATALLVTLGIVVAIAVRRTVDEVTTPSPWEAAYFGAVIAGLVMFGWGVGRLTSHVLRPAAPGEPTAGPKELNHSRVYAVVIVLVVAARWMIGQVTARR